MNSRSPGGETDWIRHGNQAHLPDLRELEDQVLDFITADLLAATVDEVLPAAFGVDIPSPLPDNVPHSVEPLSREGLGIDVGGVVVAANRVRPARQQLEGKKE